MRSFLNSSKTMQDVDLPVKLLKDNKDFFAVKFPNCLKLASVTLVFKKNASTSKSTYRPVSVLRVACYF